LVKGNSMTIPSNVAWICPICGYIHYGSEPPKECPVCGAAGELFEPYTEAPKSHETETTEWRCRECGYIHNGAKPPEFCPICGHPASQFELLTSGKKSSLDRALTQKVVIIGAGIAGVSAAEAIHTSDPSSEIVLISKESSLPYYRLNLTRYLAGEVSKEQLPLHPEEWYTGHSIDLRRGLEASSIDLFGKKVVLSNNEEILFDILILATGSNPFVPPITGANKGNIIALRTDRDADFILEACKSGKKFICIGGGLLGLETAGALARHGVDVTVLEGQPWLMPRQLNKTGARLFQESIISSGIQLKTGIEIKEITGEKTVDGVLLADGTHIPGDVVVISAGVRSNVGLARQAGLEIRQGILVDAEMKTKNPAVFAAGDAVEFDNIVYGTWGPSQGQGTIAGMNASGRRMDFAAIPRSNTLKVMGINLFSVGQVNPPPPDALIRESELGSHYIYLAFLQNRLVGAILLGDTTLSPVIKKAMDEKLDFPEIVVQQPAMDALLQYLKSLANK
jgi:nitrite reductase (NADH) large subunit